MAARLIGGFGNMPFFLDQFFWAGGCTNWACGPKPILRSELTVDALVDAIRVATTDEGCGGARRT